LGHLKIVHVILLVLQRRPSTGECLKQPLSIITQVTKGSKHQSDIKNAVE